MRSHSAVRVGLCSDKQKHEKPLISTEQPPAFSTLLGQGSGSLFVLPQRLVCRCELECFSQKEKRFNMLNSNLMSTLFSLFWKAKSSV